MNLFKRGQWPKRYVMMMLLFLALLLCYIDRTLISLAVINMQVEFGWADSDKGLILSSFFLGYLIMQVLGGILSNRFGGRNVFLIAVLLWSIFTVLTPLAAYISFSVLIFARFMLGLGEGAAIPASYNLVQNWMPIEERSRSISMFSVASGIGTVFALLTTGILIEMYGWAFVFYLFGGIGVLWSYFWIKNVSSQVKNLAEGEATEYKEEGKGKIPWKLMFTHKAVLTLLITAVSFAGIAYTLASWLPSYFVDNYGASISEAGLYSILPWVLVAVVSVLAATVADKKIKVGVNATKVRKLLITVGFALIIISMLGLTQVNSLYLAIFLVCGVFSGLAILVPGYVPVCGELLPSHGDVLYGFIASAGSVASMFIIAGTGYMREATGSYDALWYSMAVLSLIAMVTFHFWGQASPLIDAKPVKETNLLAKP